MFSVDHLRINMTKFIPELVASLDRRMFHNGAKDGESGKMNKGCELDLSRWANVGSAGKPQLMRLRDAPAGYNELTPQIDRTNFLRSL